MSKGWYLNEKLEENADVTPLDGSLAWTRQ
jgi:hypothetical protein